MGQFLHKVGVACFRHKWYVVAAWLIILGVFAISAKHFMLPTNSAITIPGLESVTTLNKVSQTFSSVGKATGRVVLATHDGKSISAYKSHVASLRRNLEKIDGIASVTDPFMTPDSISSDGHIAYMSVSLTRPTGSVSEKTFAAVEKTIQHARTKQFEVERAGDLVNKTPGQIVGIGEISGVVLALIILVVTLGALVAAGMPILTAIITVGVSMTALFSLSHVIDINSTTPVLAIMLGLAVGIDYSLFIINKYKHYLQQGYGYQPAAGLALGTAGNAVVFAALTVVIALGALSVVHIPFMTTMGLTAAATVALAGTVALTLVPALLGIAGKHIFVGKTRRAIEKAQAGTVKKRFTRSHKTFWYSWGKLITRHPLVFLIGALVIVTAIAWPVHALKLGMPTDEYSSATSTQNKAYKLLEKGFGVGVNGPLLIAVSNLPKVTPADAAAVRAPIEAAYTKQVAAARTSMQREITAEMAAATTYEQQVAIQQKITALQEQAAATQAAAQQEIDTKVKQYAPYYQLSKVAAQIATLHDVKKSQAALVTPDGTYGAIQVIPGSAPSDKATSDLIAYLRSPSHQKELAGNARLAITGTTAVQEDINAKLSSALPEYLLIVVGLSLLLLLVAFRSILVPLKATAGFLLSVLAMFGGLVMVFQWGWFGVTDAPGPIISFIPIIATGVLFGLAMDYEFFLVSSIHEAYQRGEDPKTAVVDGFGIGSKVVTAAGLIMTLVFAGFVRNGDSTIQAIGFALALGIFIDAFIIRMTIIPAVLTLLGKSAWWLPNWLAKILPNVSIEGEK